jgi:nucleoside phosphorylase
LGERRGTLVILAGACGALTHVEDVPRIGRVIDEHGHAWETGETGVTLIGVDRVVSTPADKRALAESTAASIVDMESHGFIAACERRGFAWAVVRGVSDTPEETLPEEVLRWVTPRGDTRVGAAVLDMVKRPRLVGHIVPVMRRSHRVLPRVGERVVEMVEVVRA